METLRTSKIIKNGTSLAVVIPKEILHTLQWERGDQVMFGISGAGYIMIAKVTQGYLEAINFKQN